MPGRQPKQLVYGQPDGTGSSQYETFIINELIPWIKKNFRSNQMGITGLSMGGHGAFYLAIRPSRII